MTLLGTLCGFGLLNVGPIPDGPDQSTGTGKPRPSEPLKREPRRILSRRSNPAEQKRNEKNEGHGADDPHSAVAVTVTTEAATEATQQE